MNLDNVVAVRNNKTIYRDGDKCIKVFNTDHSKSDVFNEALNQVRIEETGLNVPKLIEVTTVDGKWAIVSEFIQGKTLRSLMDAEPDKKTAYMEQLVDLHMSVHAKTAPLLNKLKDKMDRKIIDTELVATTRYDLHTRLEDMPKRNEVCHGDFSPSNIVITEDGTPCILDWSHATQGNALADVANTYLLFWMGGDISGAELYLDTFCKKSGTEKKCVQKWIPIVAASKSADCAEKDREFLMSLVDVVDYQ